MAENKYGFLYAMLLRCGIHRIQIKSITECADFMNAIDEVLSKRKFLELTDLLQIMQYVYDEKYAMRKIGFVEFPFGAFRKAMRKIEDYLKGECDEQ